MSDINRRKNRPKGLKYKINKIGKSWFKKGCIPWNKGRNVYKICIVCKKGFYVYLSRSKKAKLCSRKCNSEMQKRFKGEKSWNWKGGYPSCIRCKGRLWQRKPVTYLCGLCRTENDKKRRDHNYRKWRIAIFERDDYTCQGCKKRGGELNAHHIQPWSLYPELRFVFNNGKTLCKDCHKNTNTYGVRIYG